jgi:hypothetical protein
MKTVIPHDDFLQLLQQVFGTKVEMVGYKIGNRHHDYLVLLVQLRRPSIKVVVKLAGPEAPMASSFDRTAIIHRLVATHTTIPVPEILAVNMSYQAWPWRYLIKTYIPGQEWEIVRQQMKMEELFNAHQQKGDLPENTHTASDALCKFGRTRIRP